MSSTDHELEVLVDDLTRARHSAEAFAGTPVTGVRAVQTRPSERRFMCALADGRVGCLDADGTAPVDRGGATDIIRAALLVEHCEEVIDVTALAVMRSAAERVIGVCEQPAVRHAGGQLVDAADALTAWRTDPRRAIADIVELDTVVSLHDRARLAHIAFIAATDPLVPIQDQLPGPVYDALRDLEQAAIGAGVAGSLTPTLAGALSGIDDGVQELLARYWLEDPAGG